MRIASKLYTLARTVNTIEAFMSGNPKRILTRLKNMYLGRTLMKSKLYRGMWR